jgi:hypothetical protein
LSSSASWSPGMAPSRSSRCAEGPPGREVRAGQAPHGEDHGGHRCAPAVVRLPGGGDFREWVVRSGRTTTRRPPGNQPHPPRHVVRSCARQECSSQPSEGQIPILPGLMHSPKPASVVLIIEIVLGTTVASAPKPGPQTPELVQHDVQPPRPVPPLSSAPDTGQGLADAALESARLGPCWEPSRP